MNDKQSVIKVGLALGFCTLSSAVYAVSPRRTKPPVVTPAAPPEMRIDPKVLDDFQSRASVDAAKISTSDVSWIGMEPGIAIHQLQTLRIQNDYFEVPVESSGKTAIAPQVWIGSSRGAQWSPHLRARAGVDVSYLNRDGEQQAHHRQLNMDVRDNVAVHVLPVLPTLLVSSIPLESQLNTAPWISLGIGAALTQISGKLDGLSQSGWTPVYRASAGVTLGDNGEGEGQFFRGVNLGVFTIAGSSQRVQWRGTGVTLGAKLIL